MILDWQCFLIHLSSSVGNLMKAVGKRVPQEMRDEAKLVCRPKHENVVLLHGVCLEAPNFALVIECVTPSLVSVAL